MQATCPAGRYPDVVNLTFEIENGNIFVHDIKDGNIFEIKGYFKPSTVVSFSTGDSCKFHTSCSQPLVVNDRFGLLKLLGGLNSNNEQDYFFVPNPPLPPLLDGDCLICDRDNLIDIQEIQIQYFSEGLTSRYQRDDATCMERVYPEKTTLSFTMANGVINILDVENGMEVILRGRFESITEVIFTTEDNVFFSCVIITLCSQQLLVAGDRIGPFQIMGSGNRCTTTPAPFASPIAPPPTSMLLPRNLPAGNCIICDNNNQFQFQEIRFQYFSLEFKSRYQDDAATCIEGMYPESTTINFTLENGQVSVAVEDGMEFILCDRFRLNTEVTFLSFDYTCTINTSCTQQPLVAGNPIGPFQVIGSCDRCITPPVLPPTTVELPNLPPINLQPNLPTAVSGCIICDSNNRLNLQDIQLQYFSQGLTSRYPSASTSCAKGAYPKSATVTFSMDNGAIDVPVQDGMKFILQGIFGEDIEINFTNDGYSCTIHILCSQRLEGYSPGFKSSKTTHLAFNLLGSST